MPSLVPTYSLLLRLCIFLPCSFLLLGAFCTQQSAIRTGLAVRGDREPLIAELAIL